MSVNKAGRLFCSNHTMSTHNTDQSEPERRFTLDELFTALERNKGRLQAVEYACFGLANTMGKEATCLTWILDDVLTDLDRITNTILGSSAFVGE